VVNPKPPTGGWLNLTRISVFLLRMVVYHILKLSIFLESSRFFCSAGVEYVFLGIPCFWTYLCTRIENDHVSMWLQGHVWFSAHTIENMLEENPTKQMICGAHSRWISESCHLNSAAAVVRNRSGQLIFLLSSGEPSELFAAMGIHIPYFSCGASWSWNWVSQPHDRFPHLIGHTYIPWYMLVIYYPLVI
jgi:hypothetical protein